MERNKKLFIYNDTRKDQVWQIYSEGVINKSITVGQTRHIYTLTLSGDVIIQFRVDNAVYLNAIYTYSTDSWSSHTDKPNVIQFSTSRSVVNVTSSYAPDSE